MKIFSVRPSEFHEKEVVWKEGDLFPFVFFGVLFVGCFFFLPLCHSLTSLMCCLVYSDSSDFLAKNKK